MSGSGLQICGGEIVQNFWFEFKTLGVKYTGMSEIINSVGKIIQHNNDDDKIKEMSNIISYLQVQQQTNILNTNGEFFIVFERFLSCISLFLKTNVPNVIGTGVKFRLGFNGATLLMILDNL